MFDSDGRDAMMYAIRRNHVDLCQFLINNIDKGLVINHQDKDGKSAIHHVVNPVQYGSFENVELLEKLYANG